jgi:hypothetical protein
VLTFNDLLIITIQKRSNGKIWQEYNCITAHNNKKLQINIRFYSREKMLFLEFLAFQTEKSEKWEVRS